MFSYFFYSDICTRRKADNICTERSAQAPEGAFFARSVEVDKDQTDQAYHRTDQPVPCQCFTIQKEACKKKRYRNNCTLHDKTGVYLPPGFIGI